MPVPETVTYQKLLSGVPTDDQNRILRAAEEAERLHQGQLRESGEPYITHPLEVAAIIATMGLGADAIVAGLLHDTLEDTILTREDLRDRYGKTVELLVNGVTKINIVKSKNKSVAKAETMRKMLFAMVKDIRVILIKLADKLHNMRTLGHKNPERRRDIAQECLDIYAPLAGRLGISWLKDELEDLALKSLNEYAYRQIQAYVAQRRQDRNDYLMQAQAAVEQAAADQGITVQVQTRAKHFFSIYQKMKERAKPIEEIYDMLGLRVLCETETECYTLLGIVHRLWKPIEGRFKDYIAMPKSNRYQSLHTTVMCFGGRLTEIQIRTHGMHRTAENGVAAHWLYKTENSNGAVGDLAIISRVRNLGQARITSNEFLDEIQRELLKDSIYVFTPRGDAIELPRGATPLDFAYHIHTEVGHHTVGAKADGHIIPLRHELKNTQVVEIMTSPRGRPHLSWLRIVRTTRARQKIRHWLNHNDDGLVIDRHIVARPQAQSPAENERQTRTSAPGGADKAQEAELPRTGTYLDRSRVGIRIGNERNVMIRFANCCQPSIGDDIVGFVSRGRGIIVHRKDCRNVRNIPDFGERSIPVEWETVSPRQTRSFRVVARRIPDLFSEIESAIRKNRGHLIEGRLDEQGDERLEGHFTMTLEQSEEFRQVLRNIRTIPAVLSIQPLPNTGDGA